MGDRNCLILTQYRTGSDYNDFIGKFYHFPVKKNKNYFQSLPIEFIYFEPQKSGEGVFFGFGRIEKLPFPDQREPDHLFVEISGYKSFATPVPFKNNEGQILENLSNKEFYDPQNSVRRIVPKFLDELCLDGGVQLNFEADAHLIEVLGEQLIESEKVGILELIKNSLDAGASVCNVTIEKLDSLPAAEASSNRFEDFDGPVIVIEDDGIGMTKDVIENGWLRPATTIKTNIKTRLLNERKDALQHGKLSVYESLLSQLKSAYGGRIPLGEKGVGRFATHRLGRHLIITTKTKDADFELVLNINWDDFNTSTSLKAVNLDQIKVSLTRQPLSRDYGINDSGTRVLIFGGRENFEWTREDIEEINESISQINSPNPNPDKIRPPFAVTFACPQYSDLSTEPLYKNFKPTFSYYGLVNEFGVMESATIDFDPPKRIPLPSEKTEFKDYDLRVGNDYWIGKDDPKCGPFYFHFDIWYRDKEWIDEPGHDKLFKYLEKYGGISLYRDDTLMLPAELANKYDIYGLGLKQSKQAYRLSYRYMIANIEIDQLENPFLTDNTSREGLIENRQFQDFVELVKSIVNVVEQRGYVPYRDKYTSLTKGITRDPVKLNDVIKQQRKLVNNVQKYYPVEEDPFTLFKQIAENVEVRKERLVNLDNSLKNLKSSLELIDEVQDLLKEKAAYGISVAVSVHEIAKITANFYSGISDLLKSDKIDRVKLEDLKSTSASLTSELSRLSPLRAIRNEKPVEFFLSRSVKFASEIFRRKLGELGIDLNVEVDKDLSVFGRYGTMNQILSNLFDNSIYWLQFSKSTKKTIDIQINTKERTLIFADDGPGISEAIRNYLFEPGYSTRIPPSGLGLYICKHYMQAMNGDIYETHKRERISASINGAQFTLDFEKVPSQQEKAI